MGGSRLRVTVCGAILTLLASSHRCAGDDASFSLHGAYSSAGDDGDGGTSIPIAMKELHRQAREDVLRALAAPPDSCSNWRSTSSNQNCAQANQCGKGWLFQSQGLLLTVQWGAPGASVQNADTDADIDTTHPGHDSDGVDITGGGSEWYAGESRTVTVVGLRANGDGEESDCSSQDLSILMRLQGPEALAEAATHVEGRCAWNVEFRPSMGGVYTFDATLMLWKGGLDPHREMCNEVVGKYPQGSTEIDDVRGVVFYGLSEACCALCTRSKNCVGWSSTMNPKVATLDGKKCVLYSSVSGPPVEDEALQGVIRSGTRRDEAAPMYLGVSMSIPRRWCAPGNASLLGSGRQFHVKARRSALQSAGKPTGQQQEGQTQENNDNADDLPICTPTNVLPQAGRWVGLGDIGCGIANQEGAPGDPYWPEYDEQVSGVTQAEECFLRPLKGAAERSDSDGYARAIAEGYAWQPHSCRYSLLNAEERRSCFQTKNVTRFLDYGDSMVQTSRQPRVELWIPGSKVDDNAKTTTDAVKLRGIEAGCTHDFFIDDADETEMSGAGGGLSARNRYCGLSAFHTSSAGDIVDQIMAFQPDVVLANWGLVHRMWHHSFEHEIGDFLQDLGEALDWMTENKEFRPRFMFWLSCPFLASEREPHCVLERGMQFNDALRAVLEPRGWIEVDWETMTRKWSVDIVDGMHHGKHATRMLAHLLTYQICHGSDSQGGA